MAAKVVDGGNVVVFGAGAVGGTTCAYIGRAGVSLTVVDPWSQNIESLRRDGLRVDSPDGELRVRVRALHVDELERAAPVDLLFLALKSYDTEWAVRYCAPYLSRDGVIVSLQNGLNEERIARIIGADRVIGCVVHFSGVLEAPGHVVATSGSAWPAYTLGELDGAQTERVTKIARLLSSAGKTAVTDNIWGALWAKLTLNVMTNALAGIAGFTTRELWLDAIGLRYVIALAGETVAVADSLGVSLGPVAPPGIDEPIAANSIRAAYSGDRSARERVERQLAQVAERRVGKRENKPSLLQDLERGRRTEIDYLNGYVVRRAEECAIQTPINESVVSLVREIEAGRRQPDAANLSFLPPI